MASWDPLDAALSGHLVATVIDVLLVDAGYEVVPLGSERVVRGRTRPPSKPRT